MSRTSLGARIAVLMLVTTLGTTLPAGGEEKVPNPVLTWNAILIETLVETNTANSVSQRLCAIVHTAMFDAENSIDARYEPIHVRQRGPRGASSRAAIVAAAYTTLSSLFPSRAAQLQRHYEESLKVLADYREGHGTPHERGLTWGSEVGKTVLEWRRGDGFAETYPAFQGGTEVGQWRPTPPAFSGMSAQSVAFTLPFVLPSAAQFEPLPPRALNTVIYSDDFNAVKALGRETESTRTSDQTALAPFWEGNASVHWNQAANQIAHAAQLSMTDSNHLFAALNLAMADTAITVWAAKRHYGAEPQTVTWRPVTAIPLANADQNDQTSPDSSWRPLVATPSHPEYPAGHPALNGAAATVLLSRFPDRQSFTLTTRSSGGDLPPRRYESISQARSDGNQARVWGGMHYPSSVAISDDLGAAVAGYVMQHSLRTTR